MPADNCLPRLRDLHEIQELRTALIEMWCIFPRLDDAEMAANELLQERWRNARQAPLRRHSLRRFGMCAE